MVLISELRANPEPGTDAKKQPIKPEASGAGGEYGRALGGEESRSPLTRPELEPAVKKKRC